MAFVDPAAFNDLLQFTGKYGDPQIFGEDGGALVLYATTSKDRNPVTKLLPLYTAGFETAVADTLVVMANEHGMDVTYDAAYSDEWTNSGFTAFVIR